MELYGVLLLLSALVVTSCDNKFYINAPESVLFETSVKSISASDIKNIIRPILGLSVPNDQIWHGVELKSPFDAAKAALIVDIAATKEFTLPGLRNSFLLNSDEDLKEVANSLRCYANSKSPDKFEFVASNEFDGVYSGETENAASNFILELGIDSSNKEFKPFIDELNFLMKLARQKQKEYGIYYFKVEKLKPLLTSEYGEKAKQLLIEVLNEIQRNVSSLYDGRLVNVVTIQESGSVRKARSLLEDDSVELSAKDLKKEFNLATQYSSDSQNLFAAVLFILIIFILSVLAISLIMWNMDPGRDSIIYRMTSQRVKMD